MERNSNLECNEMTDKWVDDRLAALAPDTQINGAVWQPNAARAFNRLRERDRGARAHS